MSGGTIPPPKKFLCPRCGTVHTVDVHSMQLTVHQICKKCRHLQEMTREDVQ